MISSITTAFLFCLIVIILGVIIYIISERFRYKKIIRGTTITLVIIIMILSLSLIVLPLFLKPSIVEGKIMVRFKKGVTLSEINATLEKYGYNNIDIGYDSREDKYSGEIGVPKGEERTAVKTLEKEEIVARAFVIDIE